MIDTKALAEAFNGVSKERLMKEIHEWVIYTAPPDILKIYHSYLELIEKQKPTKKKKPEKGEYWFVVSDWGGEGPRFRSLQNDWPPVGTKFVSVKEQK